MVHAEKVSCPGPKVTSGGGLISPEIKMSGIFSSLRITASLEECARRGIATLVPRDDMINVCERSVKMLTSQFYSG